MKKLKSLPILLFCFLVFNISTTKASELLRLCNFEVPELNTSYVCDPYGGIVYYGGQDCDNKIIAKVYFANLSGYDNYPSTSLPYALPTAMPDLHFRLDLNFDGDFDDPDDVNIGPINWFYYNGFKLTGSDGGTHYIFEHEIDLTAYFPPLNLCPTGGTKTLHSQLSQPSGSDFGVFDVTPFASNYDVVSCEVFHEACTFCLDREGNYLDPSCTFITPEYDVELCADCTTSCSDNDYPNLPTTELIQTTVPTIDAKITPNPFEDEIEITFEVPKEASVQIEIFDYSGTQLLQKSISNEPGKRKEHIDLDELPTGIYFLRLMVGQSITTSKIVKL